MNIPKRVNIGPFSLPVKFSDEDIVHISADQETTVCFGLCEISVDGGKIILRSGMSKDRTGETFMHELVEAIVANYGLELDHRVISTLSMALYQALRGGKCLA